MEAEIHKLRYMLEKKDKADVRRSSRARTPPLFLVLMSGVLAELNTPNLSTSSVQPSSSQASSSAVCSPQPLVQVSGTPSSMSSEESFGIDDMLATDTNANSQPLTPLSSQPATDDGCTVTPSVPQSTRRLVPMQTRFGFDRKRDYNDFRVYHLHSKLTLDLATWAHA